MIVWLMLAAVWIAGLFGFCMGLILARHQGDKE